MFLTTERDFFLIVENNQVCLFEYLIIFNYEVTGEILSPYKSIIISPYIDILNARVNENSCVYIRRKLWT